MMWPYAYIGLETKQIFLRVALWAIWVGQRQDSKLAGADRIRHYCGPQSVGKRHRHVMWPAIAYLVYAQCRGRWREWRVQAAVAVILIYRGLDCRQYNAKLLLDSPWRRDEQFPPWMTDSPIRMFSNATGYSGHLERMAFTRRFLLVCIYAIRGIPQPFIVDGQCLPY
jgi:hypothetical protein